MRTNRIAGPEDWTAARVALMEREKAHQRERDAIAEARRALPWMRVETDYVFNTVDGPRSLAELFEGREQLVVWHFMFGTDWEEGCPSCSFWADHYAPAVVHLAARGVSLVAVSTAPLMRLQAYRERMGWDFNWVSAGDNGFNRDFAVTFTPEDVEAQARAYNFGTLPALASEMPGMSVFALGDDGGVYRTYSTYSRGLDPLNPTYQHLDLVPKGRDEDDLDYSMAWLRRHDRYEPA